MRRSCRPPKAIGYDRELLAHPQAVIRFVVVVVTEKRSAIVAVSKLYVERVPCGAALKMLAVRREVAVDDPGCIPVENALFDPPAALIADMRFTTMNLAR